MWNEPSKQELEAVPKLYDSEETPLQEKIVHLHFFLGGCDWYICEFDGEDIMFGFAILNNDLEMAEWGYTSLKELKEVRVHGHGWLEIDHDLYWKPRPACEVKQICKAQGWPMPAIA